MDEHKKPTEDEQDTTVEPDGADTEIVDDEFVPEDGEGNTVSATNRLKEKLKKALGEKQEYLDRWQRAQAEFANARKRDEEAKKEFAKFATENVVSDIIPVLDSFEMAMANKEQWEKADKNWRTGVEYINSQLKSALERHGLVEINPIGQPFDPARDEAVSYEPTDDEKKDHVILEVIQKGYSLSGRIVKAPKVKVGEYTK